VEFLFSDWLGTPLWFWLAFLGLVVALTAFDLASSTRRTGRWGSAKA
jgi:tellurite resistance protein TerC